tara:strand:+ start:356 stop:868 length:513 start_codon:yes stop_codon:yes gene_type:complete
MSILGGFKKKAEQKKALAFYQQLGSLKGDPRELRKLRSIMVGRLTAFIDSTFVDGAKQTEAFQESGQPISSLKLSSPTYKDVKTLGGIVCVHLPEKQTNYFCNLGSRYQLSNLTLKQVIELADDMSAEIASTLRLDQEIRPLNFLRLQEAEDSESEEQGSTGPNDQPTDD